MALVESLLSAIVRADGDALVMHVGERPYVVVGSQTIHISTHDLNLEAMTGMLSELLPQGAHQQLDEFGAVEHKMPPTSDDRFNVVAARGGDDIWIEIRRRRQATTVDHAPTAQGPPDAEATVIRPETESPDTERLELERRDAEMHDAERVEAERIEAGGVEADRVEADRAHAERVERERREAERLEVDRLEAERREEESREEERRKEQRRLEEQAVGAAARAEMAAAEAAAAMAASEMPVVVPMTRTVRIEVPPRAIHSPPVFPDVQRLLKVASAQGAVALLITPGVRPLIRVDGELRNLDSEAILSRSDVERIITQVTPIGASEAIGTAAAGDWTAEFDEIGRVRCTTFVDHRGPGMWFRVVATRAATAEQLGLSADIQMLATEPAGLVLVTGPRGSGKSTLMSAFIDLINRQRAEYVISLERHVQLLHDPCAAIVSQREVGGGQEEALLALGLALREGPDVLAVDELLSPVMVPMLLSAASEGLLVLVSFAAASTTEAVQRFIDMTSPELRQSVQSAMAESFRGAVAQVLLKKAAGGRIAGREIMMATAHTARLINDGQTEQLALAVDEGRNHGMASFTTVLTDLVRSGAVDVREAFRKAADRQQLLDSLRRSGVDTAAVDRLV